MDPLLPDIIIIHHYRAIKRFLPKFKTTSLEKHFLQLLLVKVGFLTKISKTNNIQIRNIRYWSLFSSLFFPIFFFISFINFAIFTIIADFFRRITFFFGPKRMKTTQMIKISIMFGNYFSK